MNTVGDDSDVLTPVEQALVDHVERGDLLDLVPGRSEALDEAAMRAWDDTHTIRARVLRDILRGRLASDPDPHGLRLRGARIAGQLDLENIASRMWLELFDCLLDDGLVARDAELGGLTLPRCVLRHPHHVPLDVARLSTVALELSDTVITANSEWGAVDVSAARIGALICDGATLHNDAGPALRGDSLTVEQSMFLRGGFVAVGAGRFGAVRLVGARLGRLECDGARLRNDSGSALRADGLHVDHYVFLRDGFEATAVSRSGAVYLAGARLGQLDCTGATIRNTNGPALRANGMQVGQDLLLTRGFTAVGTGETATVRLSETRVGGVFAFAPARLEHLTDPRCRLDVDGLTYAGLPSGIDTTAWLRLLREGTPAYAAQPYQQLAAAHRAAGHDSQVRRILIAQRRAQLDRGALTGRTERAWARVTGLLLGYGYHPWRALVCLLVTIALAVTASVALGAAGGLVQVTSPPTTAPCTVVDRIGIGLDLGTPLLATGTSTRCDTTDTIAGQILTITGWTLRIIAWAFATLFIAGFTGVVRRT